MLFSSRRNNLVADRLAFTAGVYENEAIVGEISVGGEARRLRVGCGKKSRRVGMCREKFLERRGLRTVRASGQNAAEKINEISRCSRGETDLSVGDAVREAPAGRLEGGGPAFRIGVRICVGSLRH